MDQIFYSNSTPLFKRVGSYPKGSTFDNEPLENIITNLLYDWVDPKFEVIPDKDATYEIGTRIGRLFLEVHIDKGATSNFSTTLVVAGIQVLAPQQGVESYNFVYVPDNGIVSDTLVRLNFQYVDANDKIQQGFIELMPLRFMRRTYYGYVDSAVTSPTEQLVKSLDSQLTSHTSEVKNDLKEVQFSFSKKKFCIAIPVEEKLTSFTDASSIELISSFNVSEVEITNSLGDTHRYKVYLYGFDTSADSMYKFTIEAA